MNHLWEICPNNCDWDQCNCVWARISHLAFKDYCWCFHREGFLGTNSRAWRLGACGFALCFPERVVEGGATGARQPRPFSPSSAAAVAISCVCVHSNTLFINWVQEMLPPSTMFTLHFLLMWHRPTVFCVILWHFIVFLVGQCVMGWLGHPYCVVAAPTSSTHCFVW